MTLTNSIPFRRLLTPEESKTLWDGMAARWNVNARFWYPLSGGQPPHAVAFDAYQFHKEFGAERLKRLFAEMGVHRIFEFNEIDGQPEFEMDLAFLTAEYCIGESYWTPPDYDWLIYASHENSVTIAGERLVVELKAAWTEWESFLCPFG